MLAVFGGTFDPVHYGHLRPALEVREALGAREVRFIPCYIPPHRDEPTVGAEQRWQMLQLALAGVEGFVADDRELRREGPSYMVDTLASLRDEVGDEPLALVLGMDAFSKLETWHQWRRLLELAHIVVVERPGSRVPATGDVAELIEERGCEDAARLHRKSCGALFFQEVTQLDISATGIRQILREGGDIRFLMPDPVREYIETHGLYCEAEPERIE